MDLKLKSIYQIFIMICIIPQYLQAPGGGGGGGGGSTPTITYISASEYETVSVQTGCYDKEDCANSQCMQGCVDCISENVCTSCEYGYFLFHTPRNTIECVMCPGFDSSDKSEQSSCGNCLEMPFYWEYSRKCSFKYEFITEGALPQNMPFLTPLNTTLTKANIYAINYKEDTQTFKVGIVIEHCAEYSWNNYNIDDLITDFNDRLVSLNNNECKRCQENYFLNTITNSCDLCSTQITNCTSCFNDPQAQKLKCFACEEEQVPVDDENGNSVCRPCKDIIENCEECFINTNLGIIECAECMDDEVNDIELVPLLDTESWSYSCEARDCVDSNCETCTNDPNYCEECDDKFTLINGQCLLSQSCAPNVPKDKCEECYNSLSGSCQLCGYVPFGSGYECLQYCSFGYCYDDDSSECVLCAERDFPENCISGIYHESVGNPGQFEKRCTICNEDFSQIENHFVDPLVPFVCISCYNDDPAHPLGLYGHENCEQCMITVDASGIKEYFCLECDDQYTKMERLQRPGGGGSIDYSNVCLDCDPSYGCEEDCAWVIPTKPGKPPFPAALTCTECDETLFIVQDDPELSDFGKCVEKKCEAQFQGKCKGFDDGQGDKCIENPAYEEFQASEIMYVNTEVICIECKQEYSMNAEGNLCIKNLPNCKNSVNYVKDDSDSINAIKPYSFSSEEVTLGFCYNGCNDASTVGFTSFFDPLLMKCVECPDSEPQCRNKLVVNKVFYATSTGELQPSQYPTPPISNFKISQLMPEQDIPEDEFQFNIDPTELANFESKGYSIFELNIIFLTSTGDNEEQILNEIHLNKMQYKDIESNIAENVFRVNDVSINIKTMPFSYFATGVPTDDYKQMTIFTNSHVQFIAKKIKSFRFENLSFSPSRTSRKSQKKPQQQTSSLTVVVQMENSLPDSQLSLKNVRFQNQKDTHIVPRFRLENIGSIIIENFQYQSKTFEDKITGFKLFELSGQRLEQQFNLQVKGFYLQSMFLYNSVVFDIPSRIANIDIQDVILSKLTFKKSYFIRDSSSGFIDGQQWVQINGLVLERTQFYDSSLVQVKNSQYFLAQNWVISTILMATSTSDLRALIESNCLILSEITMTDGNLYKSTLVNNVQAQSEVPYVQDANSVSNLNIVGFYLYLNEDQKILKFDGDRNTIFENLHINNIYPLQGIINLDINVFQSDGAAGVYAILSNKVSGLSDQKLPNTLVSVETEIVKEGIYLKIDNFSTLNIEDVSIINIQNIPSVQIQSYACGQFQSYFKFEASCLIAHATSGQKLDEFSISQSRFENIDIAQTNPLYLESYKDVYIQSVQFNRIRSQYGVYINLLGDPQEKSQVKISKCSFKNIKTQFVYEQQENSGALQIMGMSNQADVEISQCEFQSIQARYQAAGIQLSFPTQTIDFKMYNTTFNNTIAISGAVLHADLSSTQSKINLTNVFIQGPSEIKNYTENYTMQDQEGNQVKKSDVFDGMNDYLIKVRQLKQNSTKRILQEQQGSQEPLYEKYSEDKVDSSNEKDQLILAAYDNPSIIFIRQANITMQNVTIKDIRRQQGITVRKSILKADKLQLENIIYYNRHEMIGVNSLKNTQFSISNSVIKDCITYYGGALYLDGYKDPNLYQCNLTNTEITNNIAQYRGGGVFIKDILFQITNCKFTKNQAIGDYKNPKDPKKGEAGGLYTEISDIQSSNTQSSQSRRVLQSSGKNVLKGNEFSQNKAELGPAARLTGEIETLSDGNILEGNEADDLYGDPNKILQGCAYGEGKSSDGRCIVCGEGTYSLDKNGTQCLPCPNEKAECFGGDRMIVKEGFWRPHNLSDKIVECKNKKGNCLQSEEYSNFNCKEGYIGALCEACDLKGEHTPDGSRWSATSPYTCSRCDDWQTNALKVGLMNLWVLFSMLLAVKGTLNLIQNKIMLRSIHILFKGFRAKYDETGILIKMFTNYAQIIAILSTLDIELPNQLTNMQDILGNPVKSLGNALDCYLIEFDTGIPNLYFKILWQIVMNIVQFMLFVGIFQVLKCCGRNSINFHQLWWTTIIYMLIYLQPSYVNAVLEAISCRNIAGDEYILADVSYKCGTTDYKYYTIFLLMPFLAVWVVILPGVMFFILFKHQRAGTLQNSQTLYRYGFLFQEYKESVYYWEIIKVFQKTLIVAVIQLYSDDIKEKAILVFEIVFLYGLLSYFTSPYESKNLNNIDILSSIICSLSLITGVFIWNIQYTYWEWIGLITIFLINLSFVIFMIYKIVAKFRADFYESNANGIEKAKKYMGFLKKVFKDSPESIDQRRKRWKLIREQVNLLIDGIQAGAIRPIEKDQDHALKNENFIEDDVPLMIQSQENHQDHNLKSSGGSTNTTHLHHGEDYSLTNKQQQQGKELVKQFNPRKLQSKKSIIIPSLNKQMTLNYKSDKVPLFTSVQVLTNQLNQEEKEQLLVRVLEYRRVKREEQRENKLKLRKYFIEKLNIQASDKYVEKEKQAEIQSQQEQSIQDIQVHKVTTEDADSKREMNLQLSPSQSSNINIGSNNKQARRKLRLSKQQFDIRKESINSFDLQSDNFSHQSQNEYNKSDTEDQNSGTRLQELQEIQIREKSPSQFKRHRKTPSEQQLNFQD